MSYHEALEAAGYEVKAMKYFGSYQGDWLAVTDKGVIHGWYGSCSGCDAFEAEFGWSMDELRESDPAAFTRKLEQFGKAYEPMTDDELMQFVARKSDREEWIDQDDRDMLVWLEQQGAITLD